MTVSRDPDDTPKMATPRAELERQIMDSNIPKNDREWWARSEIERLRALFPATGAEGWKMVPVEPTNEMLRAAENAAFNYPRAFNSHYAAMLAAAPASPSPPLLGGGFQVEGALEITGQLLPALSPPSPEQERDHLAEQCATLLRESEEIERVAKALLAKLEYVHNHPAYQSVWTVNQIHRGPYTGPTYTEELSALQKALALRQHGGK